MNPHISQLLALGLVAIITGVFVLIGIVRELTPQHQKKCFLGIAMGLGVIAFSFKIIFIFTFDSFATPILQSLPTQQYTPHAIQTLSLN